MGEQRKWFLDMVSSPGEDAVKIVPMTTEALEYAMDSVNEAATGLTPIWKEVLWVKCSQTASHATEKLFMKGRVHRVANMIVVLL